VPQKYKEDPSLGNWVGKQRENFKNGRMDQERKPRLEEIGFDFSPKEKSKDVWNLRFQKLREYYEKHGHCELFWTVDWFFYILNTPTNIPPVSLYLNCRYSATKVHGRPATGPLGSQTA
jgi:hypothetical protein